MTLPVPVAAGEVYGPAEGGVTVICRRHALRAGRTVQVIPSGSTIAEIMALVVPARRGQPFVAYLGEEVIPESLWGRIRPKPGTTLTLHANLEGKLAKSLALIAVAVVALVVAGPIAGALGLTALLGAGVATGIVGLGITLAGSLLVNQLFPVAKPPNKQSLAENTAASETRATSYSISGAQNEAKPFGTIPDVLGSHRMSPPFAAKPYTEIVGDDQYLRLLFCWGYGPLNIDDLKIGETPLSSFADYEIETRQGYPGDAPITLYPGQVDQDDLQIELKQSEGLHTRTTQLETDEFSIDITAPEGIYEFNKTSGAYNGFYTVARVYYRLLPSGPTVNAGFVEFRLQTGPARGSLRVSLPRRGQYEISVKKESPDSNLDNVRDTIVWTALRSFKNEDPIKFAKPLAKTALRIKATSQLSGVVNTFNGIVSSRIQAPNSTFTGWNADTPSSNCAAVFRRVLQGPANARPVADDGIDLANLLEWAAYCHAKGFAFNMVRESVTSVYATLAEIAAAGRAVPTFIDGKWGVIWEQFDAPVVQHFTPRNSWGFNGDRPYRRFPHGLRIRFINAEKDFQQDERIVYDDGYDETNATLFEAIELPGVTDPDLIWAHGRYHIAQARLRPEKYTFFSDFEHLRCGRGDRVRVAHDIPLWGQVSARVKSAAGVAVTLDETVVMEEGKLYVARFRLADGTSLLRSVVTAPGATDTITLDGTGDGPSSGDLTMFGEAERETVVLRVLAIEHQGDLVAKLTCVDDAPEIDLADQGDIPAFDSHISAPVDYFALPPRNLTAKELIEGTGAFKSATVRFSWQPGSTAGRIRGFEVQILDELAATGWGASQIVSAPQSFIDLRGLLLGTYSFRVRSVFIDDKTSSWATLLSSQITGDTVTSPLPNVTELRSVFVDGNLNLVWSEVSDYRDILYEVRKGDVWATALRIGTVSHPPFSTQGNDTYWVSAVSTPIAGLVVYSAAPTSIDVEGSTLVTNVVARWSEKDTGWPGIFGGSVGRTGDLIRTGGTGDLLSEPDFLAVDDVTTYGGVGPGTYEIPTDHNVDVGRVTACQVAISWKSTGIRADQNILTYDDFLSVVDVLDTASGLLADVSPEIAIAGEDGVFGDWQKFSPGVYLGRHFKARLVLSASAPNIITYCFDFEFSVDVPDRLDHFTFNTAASGTAVVYWPDNGTAAAPFNGGPNGSATPFIQSVIIAPLLGDRVVLSGETTSGCTVQVLDGSGAGVSRRINLYAQGY